MTVLDEDGERVWAPAPVQLGALGMLDTRASLPTPIDDERLLNVAMARFWFEGAAAQVRPTPGPGGWVRVKAWFAEPTARVSTALAVGTFRMRLADGRLHRDWLAIALPEGLPTSLVPPGVLPGFESQGLTTRVFRFPSDAAAVTLTEPVTLVECSGSGIHWWRDLTSSSTRTLSASA